MGMPLDGTGQRPSTLAGTGYHLRELEEQRPRTAACALRRRQHLGARRAPAGAGRGPSSSSSSSSSRSPST